MATTGSTKRALLASVFSVVLCVAMLLGTTFAWFTDSVTTGVNKIQAGTLKIDLVDENGTSLVDEPLFKDANGSTDLLWEPGVTFTTGKMYIVNKGNLAIKYKLDVYALGATETQDGESLFDVLAFTLTVGGEEVDELGGILLPNSTKDAASDAIEIAVHMDESAGNEYQGLTIQQLYAVVSATQYTFETDSFDDQYDADAQYLSKVSDITGFILGLDQGDVQLTDDLTIPKQMLLTMADGSVLDLNGSSISDNNFDLILQGKDVVIQNGTFVGLNNASYSLFVGDEGVTDNMLLQNLTLYGGLNCYSATQIRLKNVEIHGTNYYAVWAENGCDILIESGTYYGGTNNGQKMPALLCESNCTITVQGGSFDTDPSAFVDQDSYDVTLVDGMYVVTAK